MTSTRQQAAESMEGLAPTLRRQALEALRRHGPMTADEIAERVGCSVLAMRPRCTELVQAGLIEDSGDRRKNRSGRRAVVWRVRRDRDTNLFEGC